MKAYYLLPLIILISSCSIYFEPEFNLTNEVRIYQVIDGDTFIASGGEYVRIIGIDAPEKKQEGYHEATDFLREFEGKTVILEEENKNRDKFGRLLRHAYVDNQSLAVALLENKHAVIYSSYNGTYYEEFLAAAK
ncbi:hypothetical protein CMO88_01930 [Candidatus Woesearchaeota archaeon]|nr:hypothetical protein [Candidatus Woesearchaeota archaeon]|tara:strand:- start:7171 stop:7575 length:405 start_codon:yes stop_codon:yes gene_type:complete